MTGTQDNRKDANSTNRQRNRLVMMVVSVATALVVCSAVSTAAGAATFPDGASGAGSATCYFGPGSTTWQYYVTAGNFNGYGVWFQTRIVNRQTGAVVDQTSGWYGLLAAQSFASGPTPWHYGSGSFAVQAYYGHYIGTQWWHSTGWETLGTFGFYGGLCYPSL